MRQPDMAIMLAVIGWINHVAADPGLTLTVFNNSALAPPHALNKTVSGKSNTHEHCTALRTVHTETATSPKPPHHKIVEIVTACSYTCGWLNSTLTTHTHEHAQPCVHIETATSPKPPYHCGAHTGVLWWLTVLTSDLNTHIASLASLGLQLTTHSIHLFPRHVVFSVDCPRRSCFRRAHGDPHRHSRRHFCLFLCFHWRCSRLPPH